MLIGGARGSRAFRPIHAGRGRREPRAGPCGPLPFRPGGFPMSSNTQNPYEAPSAKAGGRMLRRQLFAKKSLDVLLEEMAGDNRLRRALGPVTLTALGIGAVIGAGIFVATGAAANTT